MSAYIQIQAIGPQRDLLIKCMTGSTHWARRLVCCLARRKHVLGRLAAVNDQLDDLGSLHDGHGANLRLLCFERNAVVGLLVS